MLCVLRINIKVTVTASVFEEASKFSYWGLIRIAVKSGYKIVTTVCESLMNYIICPADDVFQI